MSAPRWSQRARADLKAIHDYIAKDSPTNAKAVVRDIMAATVLNIPRAVEISVHVVRAFVQLREILVSNRALARQLKALETRLTRCLDSHDAAIVGLLKTIRELMHPPNPKRRGIGFTADLDEKS